MEKKIKNADTNDLKKKDFNAALREDTKANADINKPDEQEIRFVGACIHPDWEPYTSRLRAYGKQGKK